MRYTVEVMIGGNLLIIPIPAGFEVRTALKVRDLLRERKQNLAPITAEDAGPFAARLVKALDADTLDVSGGQMRSPLTPRIILDFEDNELFNSEREVAFEIAQDPEAGKWNWPMAEYADLSDEEIEPAWRRFTMIVETYALAHGIRV